MLHSGRLPVSRFLKTQIYFDDEIEEQLMTSDHILFVYVLNSVLSPKKKVFLCFFACI